MSDETERWQRQLEQATSRPTAPAGTWDAETEQLREGWTVLGRLLEAADADFDEQALLVCVQGRRRPHQWYWLGATALATSLLLAVSAAWLWSRSVGQPGAPAVPEVAGSPTGASPQKSATTADTADAKYLGWDDAWDEQLAQVDQTLVALHSWSDPSDASFLIVDQQLQQISQEMQAEL
jgi:hypothetical protein